MNADDGYALIAFGFNEQPINVPEPATWAMLIVGFFAVGVAVRPRQVALV